MDNVKLILVLIVMLIEVIACSKKREPSSDVAAECTSYASPYQVEFPDNSIRKSTIESCGSIYKATDLGQGNAVVEGPALTIQLHDPLTGTPYLTTFDGQ